MFKSSFSVIAVAGAGLACAAPLNLTGLGLGQNASASLGSLSQNFFSGAQSGNYNGGPSATLFCVDFDKHNSIPTSYDVSVLTETSLSNGALVGKVFNKFSNFTTNAEAAALQLAIWDAVYDGGDGLAAGSFKSSSFQSEVAAIFAADFTGVSSHITYYAPTSHGPNGDLYQGMITGAPVPEPATMAVLALGAGALLRRRRRA